jgi:thiamine-phosphate pyrophosphorylase
MLICVTNRKLCNDNFINRVELIAKGRPHGIMLREKDLTISEYESLALKIKEICDENKVRLIINKNINTALKLNIPSIHLSLSDLRTYKDKIIQFDSVGASIHSVNEAIQAEKLGATYLVAGHIYETNCKKGVPPRGLNFLKEVCDTTSIPIFAIGGITNERKNDVIKTGASGMCIMSEVMTCENVVDYVKSFDN